MKMKIAEIVACNLAVLNDGGIGDDVFPVAIQNTGRGFWFCKIFMTVTNRQ